jgi:hypothetical protein
MILFEETDNRFYISESTVPNAGMGVFAAEDLAAGDFMEIIGVQVRRGSAADKCTNYASSYKFAARAGESDRLVVPMGYGGMVNHATDPGAKNVEIRANKGPTRNPNAGQIVYFFLRDIKKDEEILGDYGETWGKVLTWVQNKIKIIDKDQDAWETFLGFDIYNLGILRR